MYIDSLTITAMIVFVLALAGFIRFCIVGICGLTTDSDDDTAAESTSGKHS